MYLRENKTANSTFYRWTYSYKTIFKRWTDNGSNESSETTLKMSLRIIIFFADFRRTAACVEAESMPPQTECEKNEWLTVKYPYDPNLSEKV
jgi:hypothetical protein